MQNLAHLTERLTHSCRVVLVLKYWISPLPVPGPSLDHGKMSMQAFQRLRRLSASGTKIQKRILCVYLEQLCSASTVLSRYSSKARPYRCPAHIVVALTLETEDPNPSRQSQVLMDVSCIGCCYRCAAAPSPAHQHRAERFPSSRQEGISILRFEEAIARENSPENSEQNNQVREEVGLESGRAFPSVCFATKADA